MPWVLTIAPVPAVTLQLQAHQLPLHLLPLPHLPLLPTLSSLAMRLRLTLTELMLIPGKTILTGRTVPLTFREVHSDGRQ